MPERRRQPLAWETVPIAGFEEHAAAWQALNRRYGDSPLLDPLFLRPAIEQFASGDELVAIGHVADQPAAMAILGRSGGLGWQTFQPANAPLGALVLDPTLIGGLEGLADGSLAQRLPGPALMIGLSQLDPAFIARPDDGERVQGLDYIDTARVTLADRYEDYWAARGKNLRHNMKRQRNRLERDGVTMRLERLTAAADMARAVEDYGALESAGWKQEAASAVHIDNAQGRFYRDMLTAFAGRGEALVLRLFYDETLVASDLCLLRDRILIILKTSYDETTKSTSPAHLMRHEMIKQAFDEGDIGCIEFYGPAQDWHRRWTDDVRGLYHLNLYRWPLLKRLHQRRRAA